MTTCVRCERPVQDAAVCSTCSTDAAKALGNVPWLERELELAITRQTCFAARGEMSTGSKVTPVPFNVPAAEARDVLRNILVGWCRLHCEENVPTCYEGPAHEDCLDVSCSLIRRWHRHPDLPADTLTDMSRYLIGKVDWFRHHEAASEFVDEVTSTIRSCMRLVDSPPNRTTFAVGPCPQEDQGVHCPGEVRAFIPTADDEPATMACAACGTVWATWEWRRAGGRILARRAEMIA